MDSVQIKVEERVRYVSRSKQLRAEEIDEYVRDTIGRLRRGHVATGSPFTLYHGCSKADEQIVEVCLPTADGDRESTRQEVAFTVARGAECDYPDILQAYEAVVGYAAAAGRVLGEVPRETYLTDPDSEVPQMEVAFPLARERGA
jgi:hypothetical protein